MQIIIPENEYDAYRPRVENVEDMRKSFFYEVYAKAERQLDSIISALPRTTDDRVIGGAAPSTTKDSEENRNAEENSNIIAFTGGRGSGKTSVMRSYTQMLASGKRLDKAENDASCFYCLPMIDPSHISEKETVVDVILSKLYTQFDALVKEMDYKTREKISLDTQRDLYKSFEDVYVAVRSLCKDRDGRYSEMEYLDGLRHTAAGVELHDKLGELIREYLSFRCSLDGAGKKSHAFLVISVDDLDLNISRGFSICEDLRKYLNFPNMIILFAVNMDQLSDVIKQEYLTAFKAARSETSLELVESIPNMAAKYLEKLLPFERRCALPEMAVADPTSILIDFQNKTGTELTLSEDGNYHLVDCVLELLYLKAGLILVKDEYGGHAIIPRNLRGVVQLLYTLMSMQSIALLEEAMPGVASSVQLTVLGPDKEKWENEESILRHNLDSITQLIVQSYALQLPACSAKILRTLSQERWEHLNQTLVREMFSVVRDRENVETDEQTIILNFAAPSIYYENVTVGDVLYLLRYYNKVVHYNDGNAEYFTALFNTLYSIRSMQVFFLSVSGENAFFDRKKRLHRLLGGLIFNPAGDRMLRSEIWYNLSTDILAGLKLNPDNKAALYDELLLGTVYDKQPNNTIYGTKVQFHTERTTYYDSISKKTLLKDNTNTSFVYCYLRRFTSVLVLNEELSDNIYFRTWRQSHLSPLPLFSADYIYYFVTELSKSAIKYEKDVDTISMAASRASMDLMGALKERSANNSLLRGWLAAQYTDYSLFEESPTLINYVQLNIDTTKQKRKRNKTGSTPIKDAPQNKPKVQASADSENAHYEQYADKIQRWKKRYSEAKNGAELKKIPPINQAGMNLLEEDKKKISELNKRIKQIIINYNDMPNKTIQDFEAAKMSIADLLQIALDQVNKQLEANNISGKV